MIDEEQKDITWNEFGAIFLRSYLVTPTPKMPEQEKEKLHVCVICGEIGHTQEEHQDECPCCEGTNLLLLKLFE